MTRQGPKRALHHLKHPKLEPTFLLLLQVFKVGCYLRPPLSNNLESLQA